MGDLDAGVAAADDEETFRRATEGGEGARGEVVDGVEAADVGLDWGGAGGDEEFFSAEAFVADADGVGVEEVGETGEGFNAGFFVVLAVIEGAGALLGGVFIAHDGGEVVAQGRGADAEAGAAAGLVVEVGGVEKGV